MKICSQCVLPETFPGIKFDSEGVCQFCRSFRKEEQNGNRERYAKKIEELVSGLDPGADYHVLLAYSGGKDSTFTLKLLVEKFRMKVLAATFDNAFLSPHALKNIKKATSALGVDHILISPSKKTLIEAFNRSVTADPYSIKALERASSICNTCMNMAKSLLLKRGIEMGIRLFAYGWSPGQIPIQSSVLKLSGPMIRSMQQSTEKTLKEVLGPDCRAFLLDRKHYAMLEESGGSVHNICPLAVFDYSEEKIVEEIKVLGWENPKDTDSNSTNCLLNSFGNKIHEDRYGFHPYAFEVSGLVRRKAVSREEGLQKLARQPDPDVVRSVGAQLGIGSGD